MKTTFRAIAQMCFVLTAWPLLHAQATPAASKPLNFSTFGAATDTYTGLSGGKNLGITAGGYIGFQPYHLFYPSLEVRGTYPVDNGKVDAQKNILFGLRVERYYNRLRPYVDFLYGRAKIYYQDGGYANPAGTVLFMDSVSNDFSFGGGLDYTLTDHLALKVDGQAQHLSVPVTVSGVIYSMPLIIGVVYRFGAPPLE